MHYYIIIKYFWSYVCTDNIILIKYLLLYKKIHTTRSENFTLSKNILERIKWQERGDTSTINKSGFNIMTYLINLSK